MEAINSILEVTGLGEEYRKPLVRLQQVCKDFGLYDEQWGSVLQQFLRHSQPVRTISKAIEKDMQDDTMKLLNSAKAMQVIMQGGALQLSSQGGKADVSAFRESLQSVFEELLKPYPKTLYEEGKLDVDKLATFINEIEQSDISPAQECGCAILGIMASEEMEGTLNALKTKTEKHILIGEILFTSGFLKEYGLSGYWEQATTNKRKSDYVRDWAAAFERRLEKRK